MAGPTPGSLSATANGEAELHPGFGIGLFENKGVVAIYAKRMKGPIVSSINGARPRRMMLAH